MNIRLDRLRCESYGFCVDEAPHVFRFDEEDLVVAAKRLGSPSATMWRLRFGCAQWQR